MALDISSASRAVREAIKEIGKVYKGPTSLVEDIVATLLSEGHVLIEGVPGSGKTLLAKTLARVFGGKYSRIQGNPDILPSDVLGFHVYRLDGRREFVPGPIFANIVLFDELNRAPLRSQAALLEAMQERQATIDGITYPIERPFMVIATQISIQIARGVSPLTETLVDRFMLKAVTGYAEPYYEYEIVRVSDLAETLEGIETIIDTNTLLEIIDLVKREVKVGERIVKYIVDLASFLRSHSLVEYGPSHRGSVFLYRVARSYALIQGRDYAIPDDVKRFAVSVLAHRIALKPEAEAEGVAPEDIVREALEKVKVPKE